MATELESSLIFDRTGNGSFAWKYCGRCIGPKLGHREEKCRHTSGGYSKEVVDRFEKILLDIDGENQEIVKYVEKKDIEKRIWILQQQLEMEKALPQTNLTFGRIEIHKWSGQSYEIWKNEIDKWVLNDKS